MLCNICKLELLCPIVNIGWEGSVQDLELFISELNNHHSHIKFTVNYNYETEIGDINGEVSKTIKSYIILICSEVRMKRFSIST